MRNFEGTPATMDAGSPFFRLYSLSIAMTRRLLLIISALLAAGSASAWKVEGTIRGVAEKDTVAVYISRYWGNTGRRFHTDTIRNGRFSFAGTLPADELVMMSVRASNGRGCNTLWVSDTTRLRIEGEADGEWTVVSNEPEQAVEAELRTVDMSDLDALTGTKEGYWKYRDSVWRVQVERLWPLYAKYPNSRAMLDDLTFYVRVGAVPRERLQWIYDRLTPENRNRLEGRAIAVALDPPHVPQVGEPYADFAGTDTTGTACRLSDWVGKGKYVLLDFWGVGCGGCYAAFPKLKELYNRYRNRLEIVGVNLDVNPALWKNVVAQRNLPWVHISDGMGTYAGAGVLYRTDVMPTYILIDPQGMIVERWFPGEGDFQSRLVAPYLEKQSSEEPLNQ